MNDSQRQTIVEASLLAGRIMLENGAETSRVEDTMERIITHATNKDNHPFAYTYVTVNGIFMQLDHQHGMNFTRIDSRTHNLAKVTKVNQLSRSFTGGKISLQEVYRSLKEIAAETTTYRLSLRLLSTALLSGTVMLMLGGQWIDLPAAMLSGLFCFLCQLLFWRVTKTPFLVEYISTFLGGALAFVLTRCFGGDIDFVMIGTVAPLVPGIAITTAIRDIMAKHYLSGTIRGLEAIFVAGALGTGIATVYYIFLL